MIDCFITNRIRVVVHIPFVDSFAKHCTYPRIITLIGMPRNRNHCRWALTKTIKFLLYLAAVDTFHKTLKIGHHWQYEKNKRKRRCLDVVRRMSDEVELRKIAHEHPEKSFRLAAIETMIDEAELLGFIRSDDVLARHAVLLATPNQDILAEFIFKYQYSDPFSISFIQQEEFLCALTNYTDEMRLAELALTHPVEFMRRCAAEKLGDTEAYLHYMTAKQFPAGVDEVALYKRAIELIKDEISTLSVAKIHENWKLCLYAAERFDYKDRRRVDIARTDLDWRVRDALVWYILDSDSEIIREISETDPDERVRATAREALPVRRWYYRDDPDSETW